MQHPDEGTIHAWLDGQLPAEGAGALEAHLAECPACAAKVAEERGLIAVATRILNSLDDVPGKVIPSAARPTRSSRRLMQAAAAILVVVTGGLIAVRVSDNRIEIPAARKTIASTDTNAAATTAAPLPASSKSSTVAARRTVAKSVAPRPMSDEAVSSLPPAAVGGTVASGAMAPARETVASSAMAPAPVAAQQPRAETTNVDVVLRKQPVQLESVVMTGVAGASSPKVSVVRSEEIAGGRRMLLRTQSGKVAWLTETTSPFAGAELQSNSASTPRSAFSMGGSASSTPAELRAMGGAVRTITWKDETTGKFYSLSGAFSEDELQRIRAGLKDDAVLREK